MEEEGYGILNLLGQHTNCNKSGLVDSLDVMINVLNHLSKHLIIMDLRTMNL